MKVVASIVLFGVLLVGLYWYLTWVQQSEESTVSTGVSTSSVNVDTSLIKTVGQDGFLRSEVWGFEFEYPKQWVVRESTFGGRNTLYNLVARPETGFSGNPILINVVTAEFAENTFNGVDAEPELIVVDGVEGLKYHYPWRSGFETAVVLPLGENNVILGTHDRYEDEYYKFLETFKFIK